MCRPAYDFAMLAMTIMYKLSLYQANVRITRKEAQEMAKTVEHEALRSRLLLCLSPHEVSAGNCASSALGAASGWGGQVLQTLAPFIWQTTS